MVTSDLNAALYEKMVTEQDKYRDWLKSQSPAEVLDHAYEYSVREDIVIAMEDMELTNAQVQALLNSPSPLADVYHYFTKTESSHMEEIRDSIEKRADEVCGEDQGRPRFSILGCLKREEHPNKKTPTHGGKAPER